MDRNHIYCIILSADPMADKPLLAGTWHRFEHFLAEGHIYVTTTQDMVGSVMDAIPAIDEKHIFKEPYRRGTAPAVAMTLYRILSIDPQAIVVITPDDHTVTDRKAYGATLQGAARFAGENPVIMTVGVIPDRADTHFGYIQRSGKALEGEPMKVKTFTEKPSEDIARAFFESGEFYWNTGLIIARASLLKDELEAHAPETTSQFEGWEKAMNSPVEEEFIHKAYGECSKLSLDHALMEKTDKAWVWPASFDWRDVE